MTMRDDEQNSNKAKAMLPLSEATYLILLALTEPRHGYAIMQAVAGTDGSGVKLGPGTLYGALTNLLKQGLIERAGESDSVQDNDRRKLYSLTAMGRAVVQMEYERLESMVQIGRQFLKRSRGMK